MFIFGWLLRSSPSRGSFRCARRCCCDCAGALPRDHPCPPASRPFLMIGPTLPPELAANRGTERSESPPPHGGSSSPSESSSEPDVGPVPLSRAAGNNRPDVQEQEQNTAERAFRAKEERMRAAREVSQCPFSFLLFFFSFLGAAFRLTLLYPGGPSLACFLNAFCFPRILLSAHSMFT